MHKHAENPAKDGDFIRLSCALYASVAGKMTRAAGLRHAWRGAERRVEQKQATHGAEKKLRFHRQKNVFPASFICQDFAITVWLWKIQIFVPIFGNKRRKGRKQAILSRPGMQSVKLTSGGWRETRQKNEPGQECRTVRAAAFFAVLKLCERILLSHNQ